MDVFEYINSSNPLKFAEIDDELVLSDGNKYYFEEQLGGGGESFVLKITNETGDEFALKLCKKPNKVLSRTKILKNKKFAKEISIAIEFSEVEYKTNFITYKFDGEVTLTYNNKTVIHSYYVMDIADEALEDYLCRMNWTSEQEIFPVIKELSKTIKLLHDRDYVHRDIKPQNILIQGELLKLADFGMVEKENSSCTKTGPKYWPTPELLEMCNEDIHCSGKRTDVFMLGCIFYFIYTKKYPVGNINIDLIQDNYKMKPIIAKMIDYQQDNRYICANQVYTEIQSIRFE